MMTPDKPLTENDNAPQPEAAAGDPQIELAGANAALVAEVADLKDKLLRVLAEMENLRRRTEREVADAKTYGIAAFARDMLAVADNMERARAAVPADAVAGDPALKALVDGVDLTERDLAKALEKHGVRRFEPAGEKFDPNLHQAMYEVPDPSVPAGMVVQVMQAGYAIGERVLRPALVGVSKGGPKLAPTPAPDSTPPSA